MENKDIMQDTKMTQNEIEEIVRLYLEKNITDTTSKTIEELRIIQKIIEQATF